MVSPLLEAYGTENAFKSPTSGELFLWGPTHIGTIYQKYPQKQLSIGHPCPPNRSKQHIAKGGIVRHVRPCTGTYCMDIYAVCMHIYAVSYGCPTNAYFTQKYQKASMWGDLLRKSSSKVALPFGRNAQVRTSPHIPQSSVKPCILPGILGVQLQPGILQGGRGRHLSTKATRRANLLFDLFFL